MFFSLIILKRKSTKGEKRNNLLITGLTYFNNYLREMESHQSLGGLACYSRLDYNYKISYNWACMEMCLCVEK